MCNSKKHFHRFHCHWKRFIWIFFSVRVWSLGNSQGTCRRMWHYPVTWPGTHFTKMLWAHNSNLVKENMSCSNVHKLRSDQVIILHIPRQLSCRVMCKIVTRFRLLELKTREKYFSPDFCIMSSQIVSDMGPWRWLKEFLTLVVFNLNDWQHHHLSVKSLVCIQWNNLVDGNTLVYQYRIYQMKTVEIIFLCLFNDCFV